MIGFGQQHLHYHHHFTLVEIKRLYIARSLAAFGNGLIAIFIPIYLLNLGYRLFDVMSYLFLYALCNLLLIRSALLFMTKVGANTCMALGNIFQIALMLALIVLAGHKFPLVLLSLLAAIVNVLYWPPFHISFSKVKQPGKSGRQISLVTTLTSVIGALTPAMGGVMATMYGIKYAYMLAAVLFFFAAITLLLGKEAVHLKSLSIGRIERALLTKDLLANAANAFTLSVEQVMWPIFIFLIAASYRAVGLLASILVLGSVMTAMYVGRQEELRGAHYFLKSGVVTTSIMNAVRTLATTASHVAGINLLGGVTSQLYNTAYTTLYYQNADTYPRAAYVLAMEYAFNGGLAVFSGILLLLALVISAKIVLVTAILLAVPATLLLNRIR